MGGRRKPIRILCINCNICVNALRRYRVSELDTRLTNVLYSWVYPLIITDESYICKACRDLAVVRVNENLQQEASGSNKQQAGPSQLGHTNVCLLCGCSTVRRQRDKILRDNPSELQQSMVNIIGISIAPKQITESDCVCHPCWLRTKRAARRISDVDATGLFPNSSNITIEESTESQEHPQRVEKQSIVLPNYRRAANSNNHCVFPNCRSTTLHGISDKLRANILNNHHYYLPRLVRVCAEHLRNNSWETLIESENSIETFTADHIQHVFSFLNAFIPTKVIK